MERISMTAGFGILLLLVVAAGCGDSGPAPVGVSGTVTFDGTPIENGMIVFEPIDETRGQRRDVAIHDGRFSLPTAEGLLPGLEFKVIISAYRKTGRKFPKDDMGIVHEESVQYLPEQYNSASTLRLQIAADQYEKPLKLDLVSQ